MPFRPSIFGDTQYLVVVLIWSGSERLPTLYSLFGRRCGIGALRSVGYFLGSLFIICSSFAGRLVALCINRVLGSMCLVVWCLFSLSPLPPAAGLFLSAAVRAWLAFWWTMQDGSGIRSGAFLYMDIWAVEVLATFSPRPAVAIRRVGFRGCLDRIGSAGLCSLPYIGRSAAHLPYIGRLGRFLPISPASGAPRGSARKIFSLEFQRFWAILKKS